MKPIQPEEVSGLIDGVLDPARASEIRSAIEHDPELKQQYERMLVVHQDIRTYAGRLTNRLQVALANRSDSAVAKPARTPHGIVAATLAMLLVRMFCKLASPLASIAVESLALVLVIGAASVWLMRFSDRHAAREFGERCRIRS
jgi:anti-sigma factor RsiW